MLILCAATSAWANTGHHDVGGGGGGTAECIRWEPIPVDMAGADMAAVDMAGADMAGVDMAGYVAPDMATPLRCAQRASLFGCALAPAGDARGNRVALVVIAIVVAFELARARRRRNRG